jgi:hypothetical protein
MTVHAIHDFGALGIGGKRDKERCHTIHAAQRARVLERLLHGSIPSVVRAGQNHLLPDGVRIGVVGLQMIDQTVQDFAAKVSLIIPNPLQVLLFNNGVNIDTILLKQPLHVREGIKDTHLDQ